MIDKLIRKLGIYLKKIKGVHYSDHTPVNFQGVEDWPITLSCQGNGYINDIHFTNQISVYQNEVFPLDNILSANIQFKYKKSKSNHICKSEDDFDNLKFSDLLNRFIESAKISKQWKYGGLYHAGFCLEKKQYILPSWIWINGKIISYLFNTAQTKKAIKLADHLLKLQLKSGGWLVRYDYGKLDNDVSPIIAPNDSAYCSNHGLLSAFKFSGEKKYLSASEKCASWIMSEGHTNNLIMYGYDPINNKWNKSLNIIDIGFSADLFCSLYSITGDNKYISFAKKFLFKFISTFYRGNGIFYTSIINDNTRSKGIFSRGLAWALEGMIPYYELTRDPYIGEIIDSTVNFLLKKQHRLGGWLYNLRSGPVGYFSGFDNKGIPVIANSLYRWKKSKPERSVQIDNAVKASIFWCFKHVRHHKLGVGGIFSNNLEGGVVHSPNTEVAFVYSNCYLYDLIKAYNLDLDVKRRQNRKLGLIH